MDVRIVPGADQHGVQSEHADSTAAPMCRLSAGGCRRVRLQPARLLLTAPGNEERQQEKGDHRAALPKASIEDGAATAGTASVGDRQSCLSSHPLGQTGLSVLHRSTLPDCNRRRATLKNASVARTITNLPVTAVFGMRNVSSGESAMPSTGVRRIHFCASANIRPSDRRERVADTHDDVAAVRCGRDDRCGVVD